MKRRKRWGYSLEQNLEAADVRRDARGLMALRTARAHLASRRGDTAARSLEDTSTLVAALASLQHLDEFITREAEVAWVPAAMRPNDVSFFERYGDLHDWIERRIGPDGTLRDAPGCVRACLRTIGGRRGLELLLGVRAIDRGDGVRSAARDERDRNLLAKQWLRDHSPVSWTLLADAALAGDARAREIVGALAMGAPDEGSPHEVRAELERLLGTGRARDVLALVDADRWTQRRFLDLLDTCARGSLATEIDAWPDFESRPYFAMRLVAARDDQGFGFVLERLNGSDDDGFEPFEVWRFCYGTHAAPGFAYMHRHAAPVSIDRDPIGLPCEITGPAGSLRVDDALVDALDARPGLSTMPLDPRPDDALPLRAYVSTHPDSLWPPLPGTLALLGLGADPEIVAISSSFAHVTDIPPSQSTTYRTLVDRLFGSTEPFAPGTSNLDFRLHARHRRPS